MTDVAVTVAAVATTSLSSMPASSHRPPTHACRPRRARSTSVALHAFRATEVGLSAGGGRGGRGVSGRAGQAEAEAAANRPAHSAISARTGFGRLTSSNGASTIASPNTIQRASRADISSRQTSSDTAVT